MSETSSDNLLNTITPKPVKLNGKGRIEDFSDPSLYINRELSWLLFNQRVLEEATRPGLHPLLERVKFISIFSSNLDEFFMIRVAGIEKQVEAGIQKKTVDGFTPNEQLEQIRSAVLKQLEQRHTCLYDDLIPAMAAEGITFVSFRELPQQERDALTDYFFKEIYPVLTPLAFDTGHPFPFMSNLSLNLAIELEDCEHGNIKFARVKVPNILPRLLKLNDIEGIESSDSAIRFLWMEDLIQNNLERLFPKMKIIRSHQFRIIRDADIEIEEDEAGDLLQTIEKGVRSRRYGDVVRLDVSPKMPAFIRQLLINNLEVDERNVYEIDGTLGLSCLIELLKIDLPGLKDEPFIPFNPFEEKRTTDLFNAIRDRDILLYHPYDSFQPVVDFIDRAASDPDVLSIKQTLYRVGGNSPIVKSLMKAAELGKQVAVLVELKARFDEENNIVWAKALEEVGAHVIYGLPGLKTHAKLTMVVRREPVGLKRYLHLGTGNYNPSTGKLYTDYSFFTDDEALAGEVAELFNALTGYFRHTGYHHLLVSPINTRQRIIEMIEREIEWKTKTGSGHVMMKMNSLVDPATIRALYKASCAGVTIDLVVRGICCLKPGVQGVSENIRVVSIIGRYLEHSRAYYFANGGRPEVYLGSADIMPRNLDDRVETLFPIFDPELVQRVKADLDLMLSDNVKAWRIRPDGTCEPLVNEAPKVNSQDRFMKRGQQKKKSTGIKRGLTMN
ncbi:Polyphosphate kinase [Chlorobaculum parvum NCIB 8327]|uniref:Polyphosphate kinase n=1 Tax=Chlorobaculum parvum (strain DSM 263 / NCIMB 8327) TaxID=517417 RepID=B3QN20_CHLP8|nr:polyphosphate kinase 1 [Chlorobaculum parvum]ACF11323.1 Polyphosphate kinase [Chlorobaculum parvum NCIB 8327]